MKHRLSHLLLLLLLALLPLPGLAFQAPEDFRGLRWGSALADVPGMAALDDAVPIRYYQRSNDPLTLGQATLKKLFYGYYRDQFYAVLIVFEGQTNFEKTRDYLLATHGPTSRSTGTSQQWGATDAFFIHLKYSDIAQQGYAFYVNRKLAPLY